MPIDKNVYIWWSGATDITGKVLKEKLEIDGGNKKPTTAKIIIGWGTKINENITFNDDVKNINHPNNILLNRNKLKALKELRNSNIPIAKLIEIGQVTEEDLPVIGRTNWHQGGKGFWMCPTLTHVKNATAEGAKYFQKFIEIKEEYRLHVFRDSVLYSVKKVKRNNMTEAFIEQNKEKIESLASKNNKTLETETVDYVLKQMSKQHNTPDMFIRSNTRGWKFSRVTTISTELKTIAIAAVKALSLDFAAVDCCVDINGNIYIIELNTGPGLKGTSLDVYLAAFTDAIKSKIEMKKTILEVKEVEKIKSTKKNSLKTKASLMMNMIDSANDAEAEALEGIFAKMFAE